MKNNLVPIILLLLYAIALSFLIRGALISSENEKKDTEKTYPFTKDDIMAIYKNGYMSGALNGIRGYSEEAWKKDSTIMALRWK